jgi:hypothetical protein
MSFFTSTLGSGRSAGKAGRPQETICSASGTISRIVARSDWSVARPANRHVSVTARERPAVIRPVVAVEP